MIRENEPTTLEGTLERILFSNEDTAWSVVHVAVPGEVEAVSAVGNLLGVKVGERVRLSGKWEQTKKWGRQFRVESYLSIRPTTREGIERYLASGMVEGIGPSMAERIVGHFGEDTLNVLERTPERLTEVDGIGPVRAARIEEAWIEQRAIKDVMIFLGEVGVSTAFAIRIFKKYGPRTVAIVRENPYRLALEVTQIGFKTADAIARKLGIDRDAPARIEAGTLHALLESVGQGHVFLPIAELVEAARDLLGVDEDPIRDAIVRLTLSAHAVVDDGAVYVTKLHTAEVSAADLLLAFGPEPLRADVEPIITAYEQRAEITLAPEQRRAIEAAAKSRLVVVTGGPGTGKTTIVNGIIALAEKERLRIALAAPTGRAAKRMNETTGLEAKTIHRLLEFSPEVNAFVRNEDNHLEADLVILDEVSMLDVPLLHDLVRAVSPSARLVLVGDIDQLPSVGPGNVLGDIIDSGRASVVRLKRIFRQGDASRIVDSAHRIIAGTLPDLSPPSGDELVDFYFIERDHPDDVLAAIDVVIEKRIPKRFGLDPVDDVQILTPMHRGALGAQAINRRMQARLNPDGANFERGAFELRVADKVMQVKNDYELGVYNGDLGRVTAVDPEAGTVDVRFDDRIVRYERRTLDALVLAYATTIHKAQGSEYPAIVMPISTQHFIMLHRNLVYTGVTRGKRLVVMVGSRRALRLAVDSRQEVTRWSRLAARLRA